MSARTCRIAQALNRARAKLVPLWRRGREGEVVYVPEDMPRRTGAEQGEGEADGVGGGRGAV